MALAVLLLLTSTALAGGASPIDATPAQKQEAFTHFTAGKAALAKKDYDSALREIYASLVFVESPNARLILARALRDSGDLVEAYAEYGRTASGAKALAAKEARYTKTESVATAERAEVEKKIALVAVTIEHGSPETTLKVGGRTIPVEDRAQPVGAVPGAIDVVVEQQGVEVARKSVTAGAGEKAQVTLDALPPPPPAPPQPPIPAPAFNPVAGTPASTPDEASSSSRVRLRRYAYIAGGVAAAGFVTFAILGSLSQSNYNDLDGSCHPGCPPDKQGEISTGRTEQIIADIGLGVGVAALAAGVTMFLLSTPPRSTGTGAAVVVAPGFVGVRGSL